MAQKNNLSSTKRFKFREFKEVLNKNGYYFARGGKGDHIIFKNKEGRTMSIPRSTTTINKFLVKRIVKEYGIDLSL